MAAVCGIQGPGSGPPFMSCHQFAGLSPGHSLASSRLSSPLLNGQLSGLPGFHSKNLAKQTGSGQATEGDSRPKALPRSREPGPECGRTRSPWARSQTTPEHLPQARIRMPQLYHTRVESRDHKCFAHYWGQCGLGRPILRTRICFMCKTTRVSSPLPLLLLSLLHWHTASLVTLPELLGPVAQHVDTRFVKSMLLEHERRQEAGPPSALSPASATGPSGALVGNALCPRPTR